MTVADSVERIIEEQGRTITYRRVTGTSRNANALSRSNTYTEYELKAHVRRYDEKAQSGLIQEGDRQMRIAAASITFTPRQNDKVVIGSNTFNIVSVDTRNNRDEDALHVIQIRGSQI